MPRRKRIKRADNMTDILIPLVEEAIKGLSGIQIDRVGGFDYITLLLAKLKDDSCYSGSLRIDLSSSQITLSDNHTIFLGDPNIATKLRKRITTWRRKAKSQYIRNQRKKIKWIKQEIADKERQIKPILSRIDRYKELFK
jgi:hypothetical protein